MELPTRQNQETDSIFQSLQLNSVMAELFRKPY